MSVSAETYIVISLMFAVFAAVAAVGTSVVLGAGFERLRAGFEVVRRQSGFFADAIYKLDQRTQKLDEETSRLKAGVYSMGERMDRAEKTATFLADGMNSLEQRILQGTPLQQPAMRQPVKMQAVHTVSRKAPEQPQTRIEGWIAKPAREQTAQPQLEREPESIMAGLYKDYHDLPPSDLDGRDSANDSRQVLEPEETSGGLTTLLSRYFTGENSGGGKGVVYH